MCGHKNDEQMIATTLPAFGHKWYWIESGGRISRRPLPSCGTVQAKKKVIMQQKSRKKKSYLCMQSTGVFFEFHHMHLVGLRLQALGADEEADGVALAILGR